MLSLALVYAAGLLSKKLVDKLAGKSLDAILNEASRRIEAGEFPPNHTIERTLDAAVMKAVVTLAHRLHNPSAGGMCDAFKRGQVRHTLDEFWEAINGGILSGFAGEGSWLQLLEAAGMDKGKRKSFGLDLILTAEDGHNIGRFLEGKATDRYREHLEQELFRWVAADGDLKANGHRPKRFDAFVKEGNPGLNGELVLPAFGDLVLIFFREDIKKEEGACRAVMFNLLTGQQRQLDEVGNQISDVKVTLEQMNKALADLAGQHPKAGLRADWDTLWSDFKAEMDRRFDEVMAGLGKLQQTMETGFAEAPAAVADELERRRLVRPIFEFKADISRVIKYAPAELIGREAETQLLNDAWAKVQAHDPKRPHILTFVALGGEGKTSFVAKWAADLAAQDWPGCDAVFAWSFYSQGTREQTAVSSDLFLAEALAYFGDEALAKSA